MVSETCFAGTAMSASKAKRLKKKPKKNHATASRFFSFATYAVNEPTITP